MSLYRDQGVVLRTIKLGEADRIVTVFTQGTGKVRAVAKGIRKPTSRFGARLEQTSHVALQCYRGRELDVVTQVETIDVLRPLREGYGVLTHAMSMLEAVDQVTPERERNPALYRLLVGALRTLAIGDGAVEFRAQLERSGAIVPADESVLHSVTSLNHCLLAAASCVADGTGEILPEYLRLPDAELARRRQE